MGSYRNWSEYNDESVRTVEICPESVAGFLYIERPIQGDRETGLKVGVLLVFLFIISLALPVFVDTGPEEPDRPEKPQYVRFSNVDLKASDVTSSQTDIELLVTLRRSENLENTSFNLVVYEASTNLVTKIDTVTVPTESEEGVSQISREIPLERDKNYRVELRLIRNREIVDTCGLRITGLDTPTSGSVRVAGERVSELSEEERARFRRENIGIVF